jgi:hypothetical protein
MASAAKSPINSELLHPDPPGPDGLDFTSLSVYPEGGIGGATRFLRLILRYGANGGPFLATLGSQAALVCEGARLLSSCGTNGAQANSRQQFRALAMEGRKLEFSLVTGLRATPFAPLTQEDLHAVSVILTAILENFLEIAGLPQPGEFLDAGLREASELCAEKIRTAVCALPSGKSLKESTARLGTCARSAEFLLRDIVMAKAVPDRDPIRLLRSTHAAFAVRSLFRRYRCAARALDHAIIRNG